MKKLQVVFAIATLVVALGVAGQVQAAALQGSAFISGGDYLQSGWAQNDSDAGLYITSVTYSFGLAEDGIATWDSSYGTSGGAASDFLSNNNWFQTITWSGLSVAPGSQFSFGGLDIDLILTLSPLDVTGGVIDNAGTSLANAYSSVIFDNGGVACAELNETGWTINQNLTLAECGPTVPVPAAVWLLGSGLVGLAGLRRKFRK